MDIFVARQPIFDKKRHVFAYELLFRESMENFMPQIDGDLATSSVLSSSFLNLGLDTLSGGRNVFINFTRKLIIDLIPLVFPPGDTIVEILESINPDNEIVEACKTLKKKKYTLALDDYVFAPDMHPFLEIADIVKVDFMGAPLDLIRDKISQIPKKTILLAEKIETWDEFKSAKKMGFSMFQGYFFCKPEIVKGREVPAAALPLLEIMKEVNSPNINWDRVAVRITNDVSISYKLLRYINSAFFKRVQAIQSIKSAMVYLGQNEMRRFISVILMANMASSTPELAIASCVRARFCELVGDACGKPGSNEQLFTLGLFSLIDAILDQPMEKVMGQLPLTDSIKDALTYQKGPLSKILNLIIVFEKGDWGTLDTTAQSLNITADILPALYNDAILWADAIRHA